MNFWQDAGRKSPNLAFRTTRAAILLIACGFLMVLFAVVMIFSTASAQPSADPSMSLPQQGTATDGAAGGKTIFDEKCAGCHTIGNGKLVGPDLKDVTKRRDPQWIKSFIADPPQMLASDPTAQQLLAENNNVSMPNLGLSVEEIDQLVAYLSDPGAVPASPAAAIPAGAGDPAIGRRLFTGEQALTNGGPACIACHTVSGTGSLGGGGLGPDLTHVVSRFGEPGLTGALKTIAFPTMLGPFKNHPLTADEQSDLVAFFKESDRWQPPVTATAPGALNGHALLVFSIGLLVAFLLFGLLLFIWQRLKKRTALNLPVRKVQTH